MAILRAGEEEQKRRWLPPLIAGQTTLALAYAEERSRFDVAHVSTVAERVGGAYRLHGHKRFVLNGHAADAIVISARTAGAVSDRHGVSLFVVDRDTPGLRMQPITTMDGHRGAMLELSGVELAADRRLGPADAAVPVLEWLMDLGAAAACVEGVGIMGAVMEMTTEYLRTREQFGKKIGSFQALQHRAVDMFVETELARSMAIQASIKVADPDPSARRSAISAAKVQLCQSGRYVTQQAIQLHGGIGITDEHDVGLYFKRMHVLCTLYGDEEFHVSRYADEPSFRANL
jgi:alkylation response protein AidB-like acyl-CoA dehydrogenase